MKRWKRKNCRRRLRETQGGFVPLSELLPGEQATIVYVGGNGRIRRRYMEMGFVRGETVLVKKIAPLGDPVAYQVKGYQLSLRRADADLIQVQPIADEE